MNNKVIIFSAPSGSGKSTVVNHILSKHPEMEFSISAASRKPRGNEQNGVEYYFIDVETFERYIAEDRFVEYEQVYAGNYYGTLKSEVERIWEKGHVIIFDVDVKGGVNLKKYFGDAALSIFIKAPSIEELYRRLVLRGTDTEEQIKVRVQKASEEMTYADKFDKVIVNDVKELALKEAEDIISEFLSE